MVVRIRTNADILISGGFVITMDSSNRTFENGAIAIDGDKIVAVGPTAEVEEKFKAEKEIDASHSAVLPGFVNAHTHNGLLRGFGEGMPLHQWLKSFIYPKEWVVNEHHAEAAAKLNQFEMIRSGTTCFIDMTLFEHKIAEVAAKSGLRANLAPVLRDQESSHGESIESTEKVFKEWHNKAERRIKVWAAPDNPFSCSLELYMKAADFAERHNLNVHTHLAETLDDVLAIQKRYGKRTMRLLDEMHFFRVGIHIAHCVWPTKEEIRILAERGATVSHNPSSNMKLASGVAPIPELRQMGISVGLGTDSIVCNNNSDMIKEMKAASFLQKVHRFDATCLKAIDVLRMATIDGARCLRLDRDIGSLEVGKKADLILIDLDKPHMQPIFRDPKVGFNVAEQIVYSGCGWDVHTTIVDGEILMEDYVIKTLNEREVFTHAREAAFDLYSKMQEFIKRR